MSYALGARSGSVWTARLVALTLLWISRTLGSLLVACPLLFAISGTGVVNGPEYDAPLFQRGALLLLELVRLGAPELGSALKSCLLLCALCAALGLVPLAAALDLLETREVDSFAARFAHGVRIFPSFLALSATTLLAQGALLLACSLLGGALSAGLHGQDERLLTLAPVALFGVGLLGCAWLGALLDVARGALIQHDLKSRAALLHALAILREEPWAVLFGSYPSSAGAIFSGLSAAWLLTRIDLSGPATRGIALAFAVHQLAIIISIALRVRWLSAALALSAPASLESARGD
ncbi:MAG TPA: hypothetical protein VK745_07475 [Polyangiaceae bacterium]|jgi:hypothetical protein|nr:hypothetical protein [Polyangiaceae bacterium]